MKTIAALSPPRTTQIARVIEIVLRRVTSPVICFAYQNERRDPSKPSLAVHYLPVRETTLHTCLYLHERGNWTEGKGCNRTDNGRWIAEPETRSGCYQTWHINIQLITAMISGNSVRCFNHSWSQRELLSFTAHCARALSLPAEGDECLSRVHRLDYRARQSSADIR